MFVYVIWVYFFIHPFYLLIYSFIYIWLSLQEENLIVHIYVKNVSKDAVKIHFDKQSFTVKFQTRSVLAPSAFFSLQCNLPADRRENFQSGPYPWDV